MKKDSKPDYIGADYNFDTPLSSSVIDELPLWSAPFGLKLLDTVMYRKNITALDIGFGTGFPLIELAQRLGNSSVVYGIDPWRPSHKRAKFRINFFGIRNVKLLFAAAEKIPLVDNSVDLIISNNGINNVQDADRVFGECGRISKKGAQFVATVNLDGTMKEFYQAFFKVLKKYRMKTEADSLKKHIYEKRRPLNEIVSLFTRHGFRMNNVKEYEFTMKFSDTDAFFGHSLIRTGFLPNWEKVLSKGSRKKLFKEVLVEMKPAADGSYALTIPFAVFNAVKS